MNLITQNWTDTEKNWSQVTVHQKDENDKNIQTGKDFNARIVEFNCHKNNESKDLYPEKSNLEALAYNIAYTALFIPHKAAACAGKAVVAASLAAHGLYDAYWVHSSDAYFEKKEAFDPALKGAKRFAFEAIPLAGLYYGSGYIPEVFGFSLFTAVATTTAVAAVLYAAYNPLGFQTQIKKLESFEFKGASLNVKPLNDAQVNSSSYLGWGAAILDGRYSLSRALNMHCLGTYDDQVFQEVEPVKQVKKD